MKKVNLSNMARILTHIYVWYIYTVVKGSMAAAPLPSSVAICKGP